MNRRLTASLEDYIEAIAELIAVDGHAHTKDIADKLKVKMPSVTGALRQLAALDYIVYNTHCPVELTPAGQAYADKVIRRHDVLKRFFADVLGLPADRASATACKLEHDIDEEAIERFIIFSEAITKRSDARSLQTFLSEAMDNLADPDYRRLCVLSDLAPGEHAVIARWGRNLRKPETIGVDIGDTIRLESVATDRSERYFVVGDKRLRLTPEEAENIWVKKSDS